MHVCFICSREAGGFGFIPPFLRAADPKNQKYRKYFCSRNCQSIFSKHFKEETMIDLTKAEKDSIESVLKPLGEYVTEVGMNKSLAAYSREEILCLIEVVVTAYQETMQQREANSYEDLPCY